MPFAKDYDEIDGCPVPKDFGMADAVREVKKRTGSQLTSCYRGDDPVAVRILRKNGKKNQRQLWNESQLPGSQIRANPPGVSTHEGFNDGVAFRFPARGGRIKPYQVGMDWRISEVRAVVLAFNKLGMEAVVTYPNSVYEKQHVNCHKRPKAAKLFKRLREGQRSVRVAKIRRDLAYVYDPQSRKPYLRSAKRKHGSNWFFDRGLARALRDFQFDHGLKPDGVYGYRTSRQLAASVRFRRRQEKK